MEKKNVVQNLFLKLRKLHQKPIFKLTMQQYIYLLNKGDFYLF